MDILESESTGPRSRLLRLPYELRQRILRHALKHRGTIELQKPIWSAEGFFTQPVFFVCRSLRDEALEAFYKTNTFLWIIEIDHETRSDPAQYPLHPVQEQPRSLTPFWPWYYPHLLKHLRHLQLNIYLPSDLNKRAWSVTLPELLSELVNALDHGSRLLDLNILFTAKRYNARIPLSQEQMNVLDVLSGMKVRGRVQIKTRYDFREVRRTIEILQLENRMTVGKNSPIRITSQVGTGNSLPLVDVWP